ncbi:sugar phosphate nucleotidyltransferase [Aeromicrobium wangtongii]|uniref:Sugar phosphate nucleotidyltransferase n=1 Tax=Aeromicrobium wangtongii TaxID=2969247 RepID=A0ABY5MEI3_9ACTN|nr:sugar phosphate nucleotidyltransferase [Aeromicrobium wangtongii]MCD9197614.1 mannose-1-phosphate guanylyltransferase [Aeromicrobium wangtongii]UUP15103.1 sugar phosphate nucleotidyltransferase [Aeromicrobium wangtongii]
MAAPEIFVAALAGGSGTRLWPLSRRRRPKFLLELDPTRPSTLVDTVDRCRGVVPSDHVLVVTGSAHADHVREALGPGNAHVLVEPAPRDSLAALTLAALHVERTSPGGVLVSVPADNYATDTAAFADALRRAVDAAGTNRIGLVGMPATYASTSHGYLELGPGGTVSSFTEKPPLEVAQGFVAGGRHRWNASIFAARATTVLAAVERHHPEVLAAAAAWIDSPHDATAWQALTPRSVDHGIVEPEATVGGIAAVEASFGWEDMGDVAALAAAVPTGAQHLLVDSPGTFVQTTSGRTVAVVGLPDIAVIDTPDGLLVVPLAQAARVRDVVDALHAAGRDDVL